MEKNLTWIQLIRYHMHKHVTFINKITKNKISFLHSTKSLHISYAFALFVFLLFIKKAGGIKHFLWAFSLNKYPR